MRWLHSREHADVENITDQSTLIAIASSRVQVVGVNGGTCMGLATYTAWNVTQLIKHRTVATPNESTCITCKGARLANGPPVPDTVHACTWRDMVA